MQKGGKADQEQRPSLSLDLPLRPNTARHIHQVPYYYYSRWLSTRKGRSSRPGYTLRQTTP